MAEKRSFAKWLGLGLIALALLFIPLIPVVPFMPLESKAKAALVAFFVVGGQVLTWIGAALVGKELVQKYRGQLKKYINPRTWFRRKK